MKDANPEFSPTTVNQQISLHLGRLLVPGVIVDSDLSRRIAFLQQRFDIYASTVPFGIWGPGLVVSDEQRRLTESYLPLKEIRNAFGRLCHISLRVPVGGYPSVLTMHHNWLDILPLLPEGVTCNPALILRILMQDEKARRDLFFSIFLPKNYGGGFGRYPQQLQFLECWLQDRCNRGARNLSCLDAACGTGEGTYELVELLLKLNFGADIVRVDGTSLHPFEVFSATHAFFPHDPLREKAFRETISGIMNAEIHTKIRFLQEDLVSPVMGEDYDVILCNGLIGGPLLSDQPRLEAVLDSLVRRLRKGGILLASDRFHAGWRQKVSRELLEGILQKKGLRVIPVPEGIGAVHDRKQ